MLSSLILEHGFFKAFIIQYWIKIIGILIIFSLESVINIVLYYFNKSYNFFGTILVFMFLIYNHLYAFLENIIILTIDLL